MALPIRTRPSIPLSQSIPSRSFHRPLNPNPSEDREAETTITENKPNWSHGPQPCLTQWNYEPCHVGPPKMDRSWWRVLKKHGPLEKVMANHFSILALRTPLTAKNQKDRTLKDELPRLVGARYATGDQWRDNRKNEETEPKWKQRLVMDVLVMEVKSDAVKNNIA